MKLAASDFRITNEKIADWLDIRPEEAAQLQKLPAASRYGGQASAKKKEPTRKAKASVRRGLIQVSCERTGSVPPLRTLQSMLEDEGISAGIATVRKDLAELQLANPRAHNLAEQVSAATGAKNFRLLVHHAQECNDKWPKAG